MSKVEYSRGSVLDFYRVTRIRANSVGIHDSLGMGDFVRLPIEDRVAYATDLSERVTDRINDIGMGEQVHVLLGYKVGDIVVRKGIEYQVTGFEPLLKRVIVAPINRKPEDEVLRLSLPPEDLSITADKVQLVGGRYYLADGIRLYCAVDNKGRAMLINDRGAVVHQNVPAAIRPSEIGYKEFKEM